MAFLEKIHQTKSFTTVIQPDISLQKSYRNIMKTHDNEVNDWIIDHMDKYTCYDFNVESLETTTHINNGKIIVITIIHYTYLGCVKDIIKGRNNTDEE